MNYQNMLNNLKAEYKAYQPFPNGHLAPRKGFYLIKDISYQSIGAMNGIPVARALWSVEGGMFLEDSEVEIQLVSLYHAEAVGNKELTHNELIGKTINVRQGRSHEMVGPSGINKSYYVLWSVQDLDIPIVCNENKVTSNQSESPDSGIISLFFQTMTGNFEEAMSVFEASLPESTLAEIDKAENDKIDQSFIVEDQENDIDLDYGIDN